MTIRFLYNILRNIDIVISLNNVDLFVGNSDNIPLFLMDKWVDYLELAHDQLVIILKN